VWLRSSLWLRSVRDILNLEDGDYVRVSIMEVIKRSKGVRAKKRM